MTLHDAIQTSMRMLKITPAEIGAGTATRVTMAKISVAAWLCRQLTDASLKDIGVEFGGRNHKTVMNALKHVDERMSGDAFYAEALTALREAARAVNRERVREEA